MDNDDNNLSFSTKITSTNIEKRISQLQKLQSLLRYKARLDEYQKQVARGKELIHIRKESRYNRENRPTANISRRWNYEGHSLEKAVILIRLRDVLEIISILPISMSRNL
jgi:hypothetical protein